MLGKILICFWLLFMTGVYIASQIYTNDKSWTMMRLPVCLLVTCVFGKIYYDEKVVKTDCYDFY